jgi:hypothetical protein
VVRLRLPPGYHVDPDADVLILRRADGSLVALQRPGVRGRGGGAGSLGGLRRGRRAFLRPWP